MQALADEKQIICLALLVKSFLVECSEVIV